MKQSKTSWADVCAAGSQKSPAAVHNHPKGYLSLDFATPVPSQRPAHAPTIVPLNKVVIPSPIKKAASKASSMLDVAKKTNEKNFAECGTQTLITMEDTLIAIMPTGNLIKVEGCVRAAPKKEESDFSSILLANASVTALNAASDDDLDTQASASSCQSECSSQPPQPTRSLPSSASNSIQSLSRSSMPNSYGVEYMIRPPPGFESVVYPDDAYIPIEESEDEEDRIKFGPLPLPRPIDRSNGTFSIWDGPSIGLGERILELMKTGEYKKFGC